MYLYLWAYNYLQSTLPIKSLGSEWFFILLFFKKLIHLFNKDTIKLIKSGIKVRFK